MDLGGGSPASQREGPALRHGIPRVLHQVEQGPSKGWRVQDSHSQGLDPFKLNRDSLSRQGCLRLLPKGHEHGSYVHGRTAHLKEASQGEIVLDERLEARDFRLKGLHGLFELGLVVRRWLAQFLVEDIHLKEDRIQRIADFMGQGTREAPEHGELRIASEACFQDGDLRRGGAGARIGREPAFAP
jgi:hypothetical protein